MRPEESTEQIALRWCEENYPEYRATVAERECGDVVVVYLHNPDHSFLSGCKVLYYNSWYPGEFHLYSLTPEA